MILFIVKIGLTHSKKTIKRSLSSRFLCSARLFQSLACSGSIPQSTAAPCSSAAQKKGSFLLVALSSSSHARFLRSVGLMHPQYSFIPFRSASYVTLHSSSIMSAALSVFSGCSFAQPSGLAPLTSFQLSISNRLLTTSLLHSHPIRSLCPKSRNAYGCFLFFPRRYTLIATSFRYVPSLNSRVYGGCSIAATPPLRSSKK